jgi:hypothetical protein
VNRAQTFGELITHHAIKSGYNLNGPRSGGKKKLAANTGLSLSTISRAINGVTIPDAFSLQPLADAINLPVEHLLEAAGVVSPGALTGGPRPVEGPLTVREAARRLGITEPISVALFEAITSALLAVHEGSNL